MNTLSIMISTTQQLTKKQKQNNDTAKGHIWVVMSQLSPPVRDCLAPRLGASAKQCLLPSKPFQQTGTLYQPFYPKHCTQTRC